MGDILSQSKKDQLYRTHNIDQLESTALTRAHSTGPSIPFLAEARRYRCVSPHRGRSISWPDCSRDAQVHSQASTCPPRPLLRGPGKCVPVPLHGLNPLKGWKPGSSALGSQRTFLHPKKEPCTKAAGREASRDGEASFLQSHLLTQEFMLQKSSAGS